MAENTEKRSGSGAEIGQITRKDGYFTIVANGPLAEAVGANPLGIAAHRLRLIGQVILFTSVV